MSAILDASAVMALALDEPGAQAVAALLDGAMISAVNASEVLAGFIRRGATLAQAEASLAELRIIAIPFDAVQAASVAALEAPTRGVGLSLADRCCLALARHLDRPAVTADRAWAGIADALGVQVQLIR